MSIDADRIIAIRTDKIVYRDGNTVLKVFDPSYSTADIFNEALNQARIEETGFPVPKIMEILKLDGKWAIRREFAEGITLERLMLEKSEDRERNLDLFTDVQREIFALKAKQLNRQKYKLAQRISRAPIPEDTRERLLESLFTLPDGSATLHGDFIPSNLVLLSGGGYCVLDWTHVTEGNEHEDVARTYLQLMRRFDEATAERYLALYLGKSGARRADVFAWMASATVALLALCRPSERGFYLAKLNQYMP